MADMDIEDVDFAIAAWREEGRWQVSTLPPRSATSLDALLHALRQVPADAGSMAFVSVDQQFFLIARLLGDRVMLFISDAFAAVDYALAEHVVARLDIRLPDIDEDDDEDEILPAGDIDILEDLGVSPDDLDLACDDADAFPDEIFAEFAAAMGFGAEFHLALSALTR